MLTMELSDGGYGARTRENVAEADLTLAVAADFETAGERLTARAAREHGKPLVRVRHMAEGAEFDEGVAELVEALNEAWDAKGRPLVLNGAGNGVYSLGSQEQANEFALRLLGITRPRVCFTMMPWEHMTLPSGIEPTSVMSMRSRFMSSS